MSAQTEFHEGDPVLVQARFARLSVVYGSEAVVEGPNGSYYVPFASLIPDERQPDEPPAPTNLLDRPPGRYLVPAVLEDGRMTIDTAAAFPDERRPDWLPGCQPGDVADFTADAENEYGDPVHATRWMRGRLGWWAPGMGGNWIEDDAVPADAVLVLPAKTWEA